MSKLFSDDPLERELLIFAHVRETNRAADETEKLLRISIDTKAKVKMGDFSRGGVSRGQTAVQALDHDMKVDQKLVPVGILEPTTDALTICFIPKCFL